VLFKIAKFHQITDYGGKILEINQVFKVLRGY